MSVESLRFWTPTPLIHMWVWSILKNSCNFPYYRSPLGTTPSVRTGRPHGWPQFILLIRLSEQCWRKLAVLALPSLSSSCLAAVCSGWWCPGRQGSSVWRRPIGTSRWSTAKEREGRLKITYINQVSARGTLDSTLSMSLICLYHTRNVKVCEEFPCDSDVLQFGHELTIKTAHCFTGEEARLFLLEMVVDLA